jgi:hypothetical protein
MDGKIGVIDIFKIRIAEKHSLIVISITKRMFPNPEQATPTAAMERAVIHA